MAGANRRLAVEGLVALALALIANAACAGYGAFQLGTGLKSFGMGGLSYVLAEESYVAASNPALLAGLDDRLDLGMDLEIIKPRATLRDNLLGPDDSTVSRYQYAPIPQFGIAHRLSENWTIGTSAFFAGVGTDYRRSPYRRFGGDERISISLPQGGLSFGAAWTPVPRQSFGLGLNLGYTEVALKGAGIFGLLSEQPDRVSNQGKDGVPSIGYTLGWYGRLGEHLAAGLSYRSKSYAERIRDYAGLLPDRGRLEFPAMFGGGLAWMPWPNLTLGVEYQHIAYASERAFGNGLDHLLAGHRLGSRNGPGFGWRDQDIVKIGLAWDPWPGLTLRAGYSRAARQSLPAGETFLGALAPSFAQIHYTAGLTTRLGRNLELTLCGSYIAERERKGRDSTPLFIGAGPGGLVPFPIGGGEMDLHNPQSQVGFSIGQRF